MTTLAVLGLPPSIRPDDLRELVLQAAGVAPLGVNRIPRGPAFCEVRDVDADRVIRALNGGTLFGRRIRCERGKAR